MIKKLYECSRYELEEICNDSFLNHNCGKNCPLMINEKYCFLELLKERDRLNERLYEIERFIINHQTEEVAI